VPVPDDFRIESRKRWGAQAAGWEARRDQLRTSTMPVSAWLIDALDPQPGQTLLELAAGTGDTGFLAAELVAPTGELITSDFSAEMLATARRRADELGVTNVRFKQIDAETSIDVPAASVDGVLCRWGFMLMAEPGVALSGARRVLKPGGGGALAGGPGPAAAQWGARPVRELMDRGGSERPAPDAPGQFTWAPDGIVAEQLEDAGFVDHHVEALDFTVDFASPEDWWEGVSQTSGRVASAIASGPADAVAEARAAVLAAAAEYAQPDGTLRIPARTWVASAEA
jgi:SAM-dependent methyltransferase